MAVSVTVIVVAVVVIATIGGLWWWRRRKRHREEEQEDRGGSGLMGTADIRLSPATHRSDRELLAKMKLDLEDDPCAGALQASLRAGRRQYINAYSVCTRRSPVRVVVNVVSRIMNRLGRSHHPGVSSAVCVIFEVTYN